MDNLVLTPSCDLPIHGGIGWLLLLRKILQKIVSPWLTRNEERIRTDARKAWDMCVHVIAYGLFFMRRVLNMCFQDPTLMFAVFLVVTSAILHQTVLKQYFVDDPYQLLEIPRNASRKEIKGAYRHRVMQHCLYD